MAVNWCEHHGLRYLSVQYAPQMDQDTTIAILTTVADSVVAADSRPVGLLIHVNGMHATPGYVAAAKRLNRTVFGPYDVRIAAYGVSPIIRVLVNGFNNVGGGARMMAWPTHDQALAWLHKQLD